jgi:hypothetical protein
VRLLCRARALRARLVLLASVNATALIAVKAVMPLCGRTPVLAIPHGCLAALDKPWPRQPWRALIHIRGALALPSPARLRLVALGESILRHVRAAQPARRMSSWAVLDHPCLWPDSPAQVRPAPTAGGVRFGFFGITNKGFGPFSELADQVVPRYPGAQFVLVGFQDGAAPSGGWSSDIEVGTRPLCDDEFAARAAGVTYSVWTGDPDHYRLTASASFLEALAYLTPVIALRNPFIEHCCQRLGDIGYLCGSREDLLRTVTQVLACFPHDRYRQQQRNLLRGRAVFDPTTLAPRLRGIVAEVRCGQ